MTAKPGRLLALFVMLASLVACHDVLFRNAKRLPGDYELLKWEDGVTYYIGTLIDEGGCGPIEGTVTQLGWSERLIVAKRRACFRGDPDGWMIIDAHTRQVSGPFTDAQLQALASVKAIATYSAAEAWSLLPCFTKYNLSGRGCVAPWDSAGH